MNNGQGSFFGRLFKQLVIIAIIAGIGFFAFDNIKGFEGFSEETNSKVESAGDSFRDKINDAFKDGDALTQDDFAYPDVQGDRMYAQYNEQSLKAVQKNIKAQVKSTGYSRDKFFIYDGNSWNKVKRAESQKVGWSKFKDGNCTVRQAVLATEGENVKFDKGCKNLKGTWVDDYGERNSSGKIVYKKSKNPRDYDIDHVVALSLAWKSGMDKSTDEQRNMLANDKANLVVSEKSLNRSKGDQSIDEWAPPKGSKNRCDYADRYVYIKAKYNLSMTMDEFKTTERILTECNKDTNTDKKK